MGIGKDIGFDMVQNRIPMVFNILKRNSSRGIRLGIDKDIGFVLGRMEAVKILQNKL